MSISLKNRFERIANLFSDRTVVVSLLLGFSSGLPLVLTQSTLASWYAAESTVSLVAIGFLSLIDFPHNLKFCWAPLVDRFLPPFMGRRRGWILIFQILIFLSLVGMAFFPPHSYPLLLMGIAGMVSFFSASQDIVVDAYRTEVLTPEKRPLGVAMAVNGYRIAMFVTGSLSLIIANYWGFQTAYLMMAMLIFIGILGSFWGPEPELVVEVPKDLRTSLVVPLKEFLSRPQAIWILLFIVCYKLGDAFAGSLTQTFLIRQIQMSLAEIGTLIKISGFLGTLAGTILGALWIPRLGLFSSLYIFGILQALGNLLFVPLIWTGPNYLLAGSAIFIDNFSGGMGTAAFVSLLTGLCNPRFTAFQFALLSALAVVGRIYIGPLGGIVAHNYGWEMYFVTSVFLAIPGILLLTWLRPGLKRMNDDLIAARG